MRMFEGIGRELRRLLEMTSEIEGENGGPWRMNKKNGAQVDFLRVSN